MVTLVVAAAAVATAKVVAPAPRLRRHHGCRGGAHHGAGGSAGTTVAGVAGEAPACEPGQTDGDLNLCNWSEYIDPRVAHCLEEEAGVAVSETFYDSNETMLAQIQTGAVYDLIVPSDYMVEIMITDGLLLPLQKDAIPNIDNLAEEFQAPPYDPDLTLFRGLPMGNHRTRG